MPQTQLVNKSIFQNHKSSAIRNSISRPPKTKQVAKVRLKILRPAAISYTKIYNFLYYESLQTCHTIPDKRKLKTMSPTQNPPPTDHNQTVHKKRISSQQQSSEIELRQNTKHLARHRSTAHSSLSQRNEHTTHQAILLLSSDSSPL